MDHQEAVQHEDIHKNAEMGRTDLQIMWKPQMCTVVQFGQW